MTRVRDAREAAIDARLAGVETILAVTGGKGGIGKSFVAASLALAAADDGLRAGLLDLDLTSPSAHVILGFETRFPAEPFGIEPPEHEGVRTMSIAHFAKDAAAPLRGEDVTNALVELLAITRWGDLDLLVIDMPPGLGDAALDVIRLLARARYVVVATASPVALASIRRAAALLRRLRVPVAGVLENMRRRENDVVADLARSYDLPLLGHVPFDDDLEDAFGEAARLRGSPAFRALSAIRRAALR